MDRLTSVVAEIIGVDPADIPTRTRRPEVAFARNIIYTVATQDLGFAVRPVGAHFGRDTLTTRRYRYDSHLNPAERAIVRRIRTRLAYALKHKPVEHPVAEQTKLAVAELTSVPVHAINGRGRTNPAVFARQLAVTITLERLQAMRVYGATNITARAFRLDHGTVIHAAKSIADRCDTDPRARAIRDQLRRQFTDLTFTDGDGI